MEITAYSPSADPPHSPLADFEFDLPPQLIAQEPAPSRTAARLLVWNRTTGERTHTHVAELTHHVRRGDVLVFNDTKVVPARLYGRTVSGAAVELLVIRPRPHSNLLPAEADAERVWQCLGRPGKRLRPGVVVRFGNRSSPAQGGRSEVEAVVRAAHRDGRYDVAFNTDDVAALLAACGELPLPPYIKRPDGPLPFDRERYQTVFAAHPGAIAAPTAGLHFTPDLLAAVRAAGAEIAFLTLHVGPGTFLPVRTADLNTHRMEAEWSDISPATSERLNQARAEGRRVVAVGTTTTRALESAVDAAGIVQPGPRWADRFLRPGDRFRVIDALFTNFHLPGSTLLALVSAFAGREETLAVYAEAVQRGYRFYSYGDAMLIQ